MQQKPYSGESKRYRYVFLPIESVSRLKEKLNSLKVNSTRDKEDDDLVINVRSEYEVMLTISKEHPTMLELKVVHVEDRTKISQIDIGYLGPFADALKTLE